MAFVLEANLVVPIDLTMYKVILVLKPNGILFKGSYDEMEVN